jgi:putative transposase
LGQDQYGPAARLVQTREAAQHQGALWPLEDDDLPGRTSPHDRIDAPWVFDGPIDAESFRLYVEEVLVAALKPGDIVVLDNLGSHKGKTIRDVIRAAGARLFFLPPYSPDLNPIEQVFAKLKHSLRKAAKRTVEATWRQIGALLDDFSPEECQRYLVNAGYGST